MNINEINALEPVSSMRSETSCVKYPVGTNVSDGKATYWCTDDDYEWARAHNFEFKAQEGEDAGMAVGTVTVEQPVFRMFKLQISCHEDGVLEGAVYDAESSLVSSVLETKKCCSLVKCGEELLASFRQYVNEKLMQI